MPSKDLLLTHSRSSAARELARLFAKWRASTPKVVRSRTDLITHRLPIHPLDGIAP